MALLFHRQTTEVNAKDVDIRAVDDEDFQVSITFPSEDDSEITELLLTKEEVTRINDALFNR